jgi:hypothetical protein
MTQEARSKLVAPLRRATMTKRKKLRRDRRWQAHWTRNEGWTTHVSGLEMLLRLGTFHVERFRNRGRCVNTSAVRDASVFLSYSYADEGLRDRLEKQLSLLRRQALIRIALLRITKSNADHGFLVRSVSWSLRHHSFLKRLFDHLGADENPERLPR